MFASSRQITDALLWVLLSAKTVRPSTPNRVRYWFQLYFQYRTVLFHLRMINSISTSPRNLSITNSYPYPQESNHISGEFDDMLTDLVNAEVDGYHVLGIYADIRRGIHHDPMKHMVVHPIRIAGNKTFQNNLAASVQFQPNCIAGDFRAGTNRDAVLTFPHFFRYSSI